MEQTYPFLVGIYKGEKHILVVPSAKHINGFRVHLNYYHKFPENIDAKDIGNSVLSMIEKIKKSPLLSTTKEERTENAIWKKATKVFVITICVFILIFLKMANIKLQLKNEQIIGVFMALT